MNVAARRSSQDCGVSTVALADRRNGERTGPFFCFFDSDFAATIRDDFGDCLSPGWPFAGVARVIRHALGRDTCQSSQAGAADCAGWTLSVHPESDVSRALSGTGGDRVSTE